MLRASRGGMTHLPTPTSSINEFAHRSRRPATETRLPLATALVDEWRHSAVSRRAIAVANGWGLPGEPLRDLFELVHRAGFERPADDTEADAYLAQVVGIARNDQLAARAVLQRIMPGLLNIASRRAPITDGGITAAFERLVSAAWVVIKGFPIETRSRRVAANLLLDIEYAAFVREERRVYNFREMRNDHLELERLQTSGPADHHSADATHDAASVSLLFHDLERNGLTENELFMIRMVQFDVQSGEVSEKLGLQPRSVRSRRELALRKARSVLRDA